MLSTDKLSCNILADLLVAHGVRDVVLSPGSRNAPVIIALSRRSELRCATVVDERSAGFIALGMSLQSGRPVAMVCTSGTALLNYAPAVAEAFYRRIPLIVISADRPEEWIDQDDSQTLWQQDALAPYVKRGCDISARLDFTNGEWWSRRAINDALLEAESGRKGPVHINLRLDAPLNRECEYECGSATPIHTVTPSPELPVAEARRLGQMLASPCKVLVVAGFHEPDERLNRALVKLASLPNVAVMTETLANLHSPLFISRIDATLVRLSERQRESLAPDVVITVGGALVSRHVKEWLRSRPASMQHWHVGVSHTTIDCFKHLTLKIELPGATFMRQLASAMQPYKAPSGYAAEWAELSLHAAEIAEAYMDSAPWSDMTAIRHIISHIPRGCNLHLSNGTPVRYAQLMDCSHIHRSDCNRGVSGIDGSTSTALGASAVYDSGCTMLLSGDMSFQYDIAALSSTLMSGRMKMVVICNGGGGIFRFIGSTSGLPELEERFAVGVRLPLRDLCHGYGVDYYEASSVDELKREFARFIRPCARPSLLAVHTPPEISANVLKGFFR